MALVTTCFTVFEVLPANVESPPYTALTAVVPTLKVDVLKVATPPLNDPVPSVVVPFLNEMVSPSGGGPELDVTVAVNVTGCPKADGLGEDVSVVVVATNTN